MAEYVPSLWVTCSDVDSKVRELVCYQIRSVELQPPQVGVGVSGGTEAVVHATRRLLSSLPESHVFVKLDFSNAFNSIRRDTILANVGVRMLELYRFVKDSLDCNPMLIYDHDIIISAQGSQQGDPLSGLDFCESIQPTLLETEVRTTMSSATTSTWKASRPALPETFRPSSTLTRRRGLFSTPASARLRPRTS